MPAYQVYLNGEQKDYLLKYMCGERSASILGMCVALLASLCTVFFLVIPNFNDKDVQFDFFPSPIVLLFFCFCVYEFIRNFRKTFGCKSDIYFLENDLYSLDCSELGFNKKHSHDLKYQISDNAGNIYICPKYADYRENKFLYIKLDNGRGYAIADD